MSANVIEVGQSETIHVIAEKFWRIFRSCVDNTRRNFTLDIPDIFRLKNSERVLKDQHAIN